jgi:hypothetical protein
MCRYLRIIFLQKDPTPPSAQHRLVLPTNTSAQISDLLKTFFSVLLSISLFLSSFYQFFSNFFPFRFPLPKIFHPKRLGLIRTPVLWAFSNTPVLWCIPLRNFNSTRKSLIIIVSRGKSGKDFFDLIHSWTRSVVSKNLVWTATATRLSCPLLWILTCAPWLWLPTYRDL